MKQPTPITIRDFLENKFGYFNPAHPLSHLGYAKGLTPDIEDLINAFEEYLHQPTPAHVSVGEAAEQYLKDNPSKYATYDLNNAMNAGKETGFKAGAEWQAAQLQSPKQGAGVWVKASEKPKELLRPYYCKVRNKFSQVYRDVVLITLTGTWETINEVVEWLDEGGQQLQSQQQEDYNILEYKLSECVKDSISLHNKIEDYKHILKTFTDCPELVIDNPGLLRGKKPGDKDIEWAQKEIKEFEQQEEFERFAKEAEIENIKFHSALENVEQQHSESVIIEGLKNRITELLAKTSTKKGYSEDKIVPSISEVEGHKINDSEDKIEK